LDHIPLLRDADKGRLVVSFAEASVARNIAKPLTIPLKMWAAYEIARFFDLPKAAITA
jgi:hypothetical protein